MNKKFYGNLKFALMAQVISTSFSMLMYLIVPKILGTNSYGYWQLFLLYTNYSGFFHMGLIDGIYLKNGGKSYEELEYSVLGTQLKIMTVIHTMIALVFCFSIVQCSIEQERKMVVLCFSIYMIFYNFQNFIGFVFQAVNETKIYSIAVIIEKIASLIATTILILINQKNFIFYILVYVGSISLNSFYLLYRGRKIVFSKVIGIKKALLEARENIKIGIVLMFSGIASTLLIGASRMIVDYAWGIEIFGKLSFAISMINMLLLFVRQISVVLFPALRQLRIDEQKKIYQESINFLRVCLPIIYFSFVPMKFFLMSWLPQYTESIMYLSLLLPVCLYDGKMQLLFNTYFKVLRKEKFLLGVNIFSLVCSIILALFSVIVINRINFVAISIDIAIAIRSIISECYMRKILEVPRKKFWKEMLFEVLLSIVFLVTINFFNEVIMIVFMIITYILFIFCCSEQIHTIKQIIGKLQKVYSKIIKIG